MDDLVALSGVVTDCNPVASPSLSKREGEKTMAVKNVKTLCLEPVCSLSGWQTTHGFVRIGD